LAAMNISVMLDFPEDSINKVVGDTLSRGMHITFASRWGGRPCR